VLCNVDLSQKWGDYTRVFSLMKAFSDRGHDVTIFVIRPEKKKQSITNFQENSLNVYEIHPPLFTPFNGKRGIGKYVNYFLCNMSIKKLASEIMKKNKIDYVYSYMPGIGSSYPAMKIKSKLKIKHVLDFADFHVYVRPKRLAMDSFRNADKIIAITDYLKQFLIKKGIDEEKIQLVPNGVDLELFNPSKYSITDIQELRKSFHAKNIIVFSGALQDLSIIINSAKTVAEKFPDLKYVILGDHRDPNRSKDNWEKQVYDKGLEKFFLFLGKKPRYEIPKYLLCADICIDSFPDEPYYAAAHPVKLLEYGACKKAIVATRVSETQKLLKHNEHGFLASPSNPDEFATFLLTLLNSSELREKMGNTFSLHIRENFDWNKLAMKLESILED
jgi:glycosyltransferase involved in cell wall biosynthesis